MNSNRLNKVLRSNAPLGTSSYYFISITFKKYFFFRIHDVYLDEIQV